MNAKLLFDLNLDRQPVRVPPGFARNAPPAHRLVEREKVFDDAREDVPVVGQAGRSPRPLEEEEPPLRRGLREALFEDLFSLPEAKDLSLFFGKVELRRHLPE